jgi:hypothetical protein
VVTWTIVTGSPPSDPAILSEAELRAAAGLAPGDTSQDTDLALIGLEAGEWIAELCGVAAADGRPPTLTPEDIIETVRLPHNAATIVLARRFVSAVEVFESGAAIDAADFAVNADAGIIQRLSAGAAYYWPSATTITINYTAGLAPMPATIKSVAMDFVRMRLAQRGRGLDLMVKSETTVDLDSVTYFDGSEGEGVFEEAALKRLGRFANIPVG